MKNADKKIKLRFWQKAYLLTLALFLLCINGGILSLTVYTHGENVKAAEEAAKAQQYYVAVSFERDMEYLAENEAGKPYWQVFPDCVNLIRTLPLLQFLTDVTL